MHYRRDFTSLNVNLGKEEVMKLSLDADEYELRKQKLELGKPFDYSSDGNPALQRQSQKQSY